MYSALLFAVGKFLIVSDVDPMLVSCLNCSPNNLSKILVVVVVVFVVVISENCNVTVFFFVRGGRDDDSYQ